MEGLWNLRTFNKAVVNLGVIGPAFFVSASLFLAIITGGTFTLGTHTLAYWEGIIYGLVGITVSIYSFFVVNKD